MTWRFLPLTELILFLLIAMGWRCWLQYRRTGSTGFLLFRTGGVQMVRDAALLLLNVLFAAQAVALLRGRVAVAPEPWPLVGTLAALVGIALVVWAQLDLGASWRIGIEEGARPGLVTSRWYTFCRNPIYLFMFLVYGGLSVQLPTTLSMVLFVGLCLGIRVNVVQHEEPYLERTYGEDFRAYAQRVGRFVPWIGRFPHTPARATVTTARV